MRNDETRSEKAAERGGWGLRLETDPAMKALKG